MKRIVHEYLKLKPVHQRVARIGVLVIATIAMYFLVYSPIKQNHDKLAENVRKTTAIVATQDANLSSVKDPGTVRDKIDPETKNALKTTNNKIVTSSELAALIDQIKADAKETGGTNIDFAEGQPGKDHIKHGPRDDVFEVNTLPLSCNFNSSYAGVSNFLFQLKSLGNMIRIKSVNLKSIDSSSAGIAVKIEIEIFYTEES